MASDQLVTARHVLQSVTELQRRRSGRVLWELGKLEPDLAEYVLENLTQLHYQLVQDGLSHKQARRIYGLAESTLLVSLMALQKGYRELFSANGGDDAHAQPDVNGVAPPHQQP